MEILNEVYFGREPVQPLRNLISSIRSKVQNKPYSPNINTDPDVLKFAEQAKKIFGFHSFSVSILNDNYPNAAALSVDTFYTDNEKKELAKYLIANPTGFRYKDAAGISFVITLNTGIFNYSEISDDQIMAVILHEIGHGFFEAVISEDNGFTTSRKLSSMIININKIVMDKYRSGKKLTEEIIDKELNLFNNSIKSIRKSVARIANRLVREAMSDNLKPGRLDYTNEKFADTFAAIYGYASSLSDFNLNMMNIIGTHNHLKIKKIPKVFELIKMYKMYVLDMLAYTMNCTSDPHPNDVARVKTTIDYIRHELANESIDPKLKKELVNELNRVTKLLEDYKRFPRDKDFDRIYRLYSIKMLKKFGGDRREKDTDNKALFDFIDSRYKNLSDPNRGIDDVDDVPQEPVEESVIYTQLDEYLDTFCASADCYNESAMEDIKNRVIGIKDLKEQWQKHADSFVKSRWIVRYINEKQKEQLKKHYDIVCDKTVPYSTYKKSFDAICKFVGLPSDPIIIESIFFKKDKKDREQDVFVVGYYKGKVKIKIPEGFYLIHGRAHDDIDIEAEGLKPSFRSKNAGIYLYPTKRVYFTVIKPINTVKMGFLKDKPKKIDKYTPKTPIREAYIDPSCSDFSKNAVYVETETPIPAMSWTSFSQRLLNDIKQDIHGMVNKK